MRFDRFLGLFALAILIFAAAGGCDPATRPFASDSAERARNNLLVLKDHRGIVVDRIAGPPRHVAEGLAEATAEALRRENVPAATAGSNRSSYVLRGAAQTRKLDTGRLEITLRWRLFDAGGKQVGARRTRMVAPAADWRAADKRLLQRLARHAAPDIASLIQQRPARDVIDRARTTPLHVRPVTGLSAPEGRILRLAMMTALRRAKLRVVRRPATGGLALVGRVSLTRAVAGGRDLEVVWRVERPDGALVGRLTQRNAIEEDRYLSDWPGIADLIAAGAAGGVLDLLRRAVLPPAGEPARL